MFSIAHDDDLIFAERLLAKIVDDHEYVLDDPEVNIRIQHITPSSIDIIVRPWVETEHYWDV